MRHLTSTMRIVVYGVALLVAAGDAVEEAGFHRVGDEPHFRPLLLVVSLALALGPLAVALANRVRGTAIPFGAACFWSGLVLLLWSFFTVAVAHGQGFFMILAALLMLLASLRLPRRTGK